MRRLRWKLAVGLALLGLVGAAAFAWLTLSSGRPPFIEKTAERIKVGMTRAEVEAVLGGPRGNYSKARDVGYGPAGFSFLFLDAWRDDYGWIAVKFDERDTVVRVLYNPSMFPPEPEPFWKRLLPW